MAPRPGLGPALLCFSWEAPACSCAWLEPPRCRLAWGAVEVAGARGGVLGLLRPSHLTRVAFFHREETASQGCTPRLHPKAAPQGCTSRLHPSRCALQVVGL